MFLGQYFFNLMCYSMNGFEDDIYFLFLVSYKVGGQNDERVCGCDLYMKIRGRY